MPNDSGSVPCGLRADVAESALAGLTASPKTLPAKLFYDAEGCRLFYAITKLPEYYLTRTETALLRSLGRSLLPDGLRGAALVEFGGSDETKARYLLDLRDGRGEPVFNTYVPIDVAEAALTELRRRMAVSHPHVTTVPLAADFMTPLRLPPLGRHRLGFFPGSTIGNLDPGAAVGFLAAARDSLGPNAWFLLGADLRKAPEVLLPAYNDAEGVTAAFNLNLLRRLNREAGADFDLRLFGHRAIWNADAGRIEMHLISTRDQTVRVAGRTIMIARDESIHTENSYKFTPRILRDTASAAGWEVQRAWTDPANYFGISLLRHA
nr:L-histidine N(alpha)-methyltransferase [uncultured Rhodopila sp.]